MISVFSTVVFAILACSVHSNTADWTFQSQLQGENEQRHVVAQITVEVPVYFTAQMQMGVAKFQSSVHDKSEWDLNLGLEQNIVNFKGQVLTDGSGNCAILIDGKDMINSTSSLQKTLDVDKDVARISGAVFDGIVPVYATFHETENLILVKIWTITQDVFNQIEENSCETVQLQNSTQYHKFMLI